MNHDRHRGTLALLASRRFLPLFLTQFLGAFNDNVYKNALVVMLTFGIGTGGEPGAAWLITVAAGIFIAPFFLFSASAGQLADKYERAALLRRVKLAEVVIMLAAAVAFLLASPVALMALLFLMGTQSTLFGPLKYALLPQYLAPHELAAGNGLVQMSTYLAILAGTMAGGLLVAVEPDGRLMVGATVVGLALLGWLSSRVTPPAPAPAPGLVIDRNPLRATGGVLGEIRAGAGLLPAVLGVSWFWFVGATFLQLLPAYARDSLGGGPALVTLLLTAFSIGIGVGALACARLAHGGAGERLVLPAALGMAVFAIGLWLLPATPPAQVAEGWLAALAQRGNWPQLACFGALAVSGGLYVVPLYVLVQTRSDADRRARVIAALNVVNAAFMVGSALLTVALLALGVPVSGIFALTGVGSAGVGFWLWQTLKLRPGGSAPTA